MGGTKKEGAQRGDPGFPEHETLTFIGLRKQTFSITGEAAAPNDDCERPVLGLTLLCCRGVYDQRTSASRHDLLPTRFTPPLPCSPILLPFRPKPDAE